MKEQPKFTKNRLEEFWFCWLRTGEDPKSFSAERTAELMRGHMGNIGKLAESGDLVSAGPYDARDPKAPFRGVFVFDAKNEYSARKLAESDPSVQAGMFRLEFASFRTFPELRLVNKWHREATSGPIEKMGYMRLYILVDAKIRPGGARHEKLGQGLAGLGTLWDRGQICLFGRVSDPDGERVILALNATTLESAKALLAQDGPAKTLEVINIDPWYCSEGLTLLSTAVDRAE